MLWAIKRVDLSAHLPHIQIFFPTSTMALIAALAAVSVMGNVARALPQSGVCQGAYRSPKGDLVALTPAFAATAAAGERYTLLDGEQGNLTDASAPLTCQHGVLRDRSDAVWAKVELVATPVTFAARDGVRLNGLLLEPLHPREKPPLVVFVHGSEKTSPIGGYFQVLAAAQGISVLAYDKRGTGASGGVYTQDFGLLADDAAAALDAARRLAAGRYSRAGFFGGSQGGWVAPAAALKAHAEFIEVGFGVVGTALEQDQWQVDVQLEERGFAITPEIHEVTNATAEVAGSDFKAHFDSLKRVRAKYGSEPWFSLIDGQYSGELLKGEIDQAREESPQVPWHYSGEDALRKLRIPQLWVMAQDDSIAPSAVSITRLEQLKSAGADIRVVVFPHTDHGIRLYTVDAQGQHHRTRMAEGYLRLLADWAKRQWRPPYDDSSIRQR
jgi:uncharacterized protein